MQDTAVADEGSAVSVEGEGSAVGDGGAAIVADGVRRTYGDVVALDGVDLAVGSGEVFGLIGPNGAGKTTLVRALTGTTEFEGGVRVFGRSPRAVDPARIGLLPQSFDPPARLTARELVGYYGGLYDEARDVDAVLRDVGMADDADTWYETLSGGQKRRTCVATALVNDPDLLFLDEPTTGIDPAGRRSLHRLIERLAAGGTTVFLTSHAMDEVERLADRVALLRDGRVVASGAPAALIAEHGGRPRLDVLLASQVTEEELDRLSTRVTNDLDGEVVIETSEGADVTSAESADVTSAESVDVASTENGLRFVGVRPEAIGSAVDTLESVGIAFESLTWSEPSLEDVYLRLTGEEYTPRGGGSVEASETVASTEEADSTAEGGE